VILECLTQFGRAEQAADMVGAKGRATLGILDHMRLSIMWVSWRRVLSLIFYRSIDEV
jgi:hypothetical protein